MIDPTRSEEYNFLWCTTNWLLGRFQIIGGHVIGFSGKNYKLITELSFICTDDSEREMKIILGRTKCPSEIMKFFRSFARSASRKSKRARSKRQ